MLSLTWNTPFEYYFLDMPKIKSSTGEIIDPSFPVALITYTNKHVIIF